MDQGAVRHDQGTMTLTDYLPDGGDPDALFDAFSAWATDQGISLYPAQQDALIEVVSDSHVIVNTPTTIDAIVSGAGGLNLLSDGTSTGSGSSTLALTQADTFAGVVTIDALAPVPGRPIYFSWDDHANAQRG